MRQLLDAASARFRAAGHFPYHYARGKLGGDPIFREMLERKLLGPGGRLLDLGCGQGSLFAWLLAAADLHDQGQWPADWPAPPRFRSLRGVELMARDVERAAIAFGPAHPVVRVEQGDMNEVDFGQVDVVTILDALHYFDHEHQRRVLERIHAALPVDGIFLTRIGDASAGLPFHVCLWVDRTVTFVRGHRLPKMYSRTLADWKALLERTGFAVQTDALRDGKPFANVMLVCRKRAAGIL